MNRIIHLSHDSLTAKSKQDESFDQENFPGEDYRTIDSLSITDARIFMPQNYEPNYAYPLIVYLQGREGSTSEYQMLMEEISIQNHLAIELDVDNESGSSSQDFIQQIQEAVSQMSRHYNVHSERIFIMGDAHRGTLAMKMVLSHPELFWGFIALNPDRPELERPLFQFRYLHRMRGFLYSEVDNPWVQNYSQLLHDSGLKIHLDQKASHSEPHRFSNADDRICRLIDRFIVQGIWETYSE